HLLLELFNFGFHLLPKRFLWRLLARLAESYDHLFRSFDVDPCALRLPTLAVGDRPVDHLRFKLFVQGEEIFAGHLTEWFLCGGGLSKRDRRSRDQTGGGNSES